MKVTLSLAPILAAALVAGAASPPPEVCVKGPSHAGCASAKKHAAAHSVVYAPEPAVYEPTEAVETVATDTPAPAPTIAKATRACHYVNGRKVCR